MGEVDREKWQKRHTYHNTARNTEKRKWCQWRNYCWENCCDSVTHSHNNIKIHYREWKMVVLVSKWVCGGSGVWVHCTCHTNNIPIQIPRSTKWLYFINIKPALAQCASINNNNIINVNKWERDAIRMPIKCFPFLELTVPDTVKKNAILIIIIMAAKCKKKIEMNKNHLFIYECCTFWEFILKIIASFLEIYVSRCHFLRI